jgi:hypothetical protein
MSAADLKSWMSQKDKRVVDIAAATRIHPNTIQRFLSGKRVHDSTKTAFARLIADDPIEPKEPKRSVF